MNDDRLVIVDIETTGLEVESDLVLEVGIRIVNADSLEMIGEISTTIWDGLYYSSKLREMIRDPKCEYVVKMHQQSGLWDEAERAGVTLDEASEKLSSWLASYGDSGQDPMMGSNVGFDRGFLSTHLPEVHDWFHYRNIDVSSIKELCRRYNKPVFDKLGEFTSKQEKHRAIHDITDTIAEFEYYRDNFLWVAGA